MQLTFAKYEGAGNDFILIDLRGGNPAGGTAKEGADREGGFVGKDEADREGGTAKEGGFEMNEAEQAGGVKEGGVGNKKDAIVLNSDLIARLCDRHFGIGADGLMTLSLDAEGVPVMHYYNADGSEGEMCGNGARCFALFLHHSGLCDEHCRFTATDGPHEAILRHIDGACGEVEVGMRSVSEILPAGGDLPGRSLNTGVPHYVEFVERLDEVDLPFRGRQIRYNTDLFPQGTNVNFATVIGRGEVRMRTYERGVEAETLACGTGATAVALVTNLLYQPDVDTFTMHLPGGRLTIRFRREAHTTRYTDIRLTGPARRVFDGSVDTTSLTYFNLNR